MQCDNLALSHSGWIAFIFPGSGFDQPTKFYYPWDYLSRHIAPGRKVGFTYIPHVCLYVFDHESPQIC